MATNPCKSIRLADGLLPGDTRRGRKRSGFAITSGDNFQATLIIWFYKVIHGVYFRGWQFRSVIYPKNGSWGRSFFTQSRREAENAEGNANLKRYRSCQN